MSKNQGKRNRERGAEFERESCKHLHALGFKTARKTGSIQANGEGDPDIAGVFGIWISCKRWKNTMRWPLWWRDAEERTPSGSVPLILHRKDKGEIHVSFKLKDIHQIMAGLNDSLEISRRLDI